MLRVSLCLGVATLLYAADLPHHLIHPSRPLTPQDSRASREIALDFTKAQGSVAAKVIAAGDLYIAKQYRTNHNGVTHIVYQQQHAGLDIYGAEWVVNIDSEGRVLNAGGHLFEPAATTASTRAHSRTSLESAARTALLAVDPQADTQALNEVARSSNVPLRANQVTRFRAGAGQRAEIEGSPAWYPVRGRLEPVWIVTATAEDGIETEEVVVSAESDRILRRESMTWHQTQQPPTPRGLVFTSRSPQPTPQPGTKLEAEPPYVPRQLVSFTGDPVASPFGWFSGNSTIGNNTITGINPLGITFLTEPITATSPTRDFQFPLELGPGAPPPTQFQEAAATNLFYWVNRIHDFFYTLGFDEAAGNYQQHNYGRGGVGGDPMLAYGHCGASGLGLASLNNAFFSTRSRLDGFPSMICMFLGTSPGRWADGAYSSETIIHEYTHGVTSRLVRGITGHQGGSMNEAFSDFWALEFLTPEGAPPDGIYPYGEYLYNTFGVGIRSRPYSTNMEVNPLTYRDLGRATNFVSVHNDGGIWVMALWEMRANLIAQFGEREGRRRLRQNVLDGMKLAPPGPSMVDVRDAILLADRVNFRGASQDQIWAAFAKRGLGVLAYSSSADTIIVSASYDRPSTEGRMAFQIDQPAIGEAAVIRLHDNNLTADSTSVQVLASSGDLETIPLRRQGSLFTGTVFTTVTPTAKESGALSVIPGDYLTAFYNDVDNGAGFKQITASTLAFAGYATTVGTLPYTFTNERALNFRRNPNTIGTLNLPFDFPFFDRKVRQVRLNSNGQLLFDTTLPPACYDRASLPSQMGVAAMWAWLRTDGNAQPGEDIYLSQPTPDALTLRWVAETAPFIPGQFGFVPEPVNFAITLFADGRIRYQYGPNGNTNVVNSQAFTSCEAGLPIVGISRGTGTYTSQPISHYARSNFATAPALEFQPSFGYSSFPAVVLESPASSARVSGLLDVRGIASDSNSFVNGVHILIDGIYRARTTASLTRPDYCSANPTVPGCPFVGFATTLDLAALGIGPGTHSLQLRVVNARGGFTDYPARPVPFEVTSDAGAQAQGRIEGPAGGATVRGITEITGYAYGRATRVTAVEILIDDITFGRATYGLARAELCAGSGEAAGSPNCPGIGFRFAMNTATVTPTLPNGRHQVRLRLVDALGRLTLLEPQTIVVDNPANQPPDGAMTAPVNGARVSGTLRVTGHAYDPDGRITQVLLLVDGGAVAVATYGRPSPEACAGLPNVGACPNIGYEVTFDTRTLSNGLHRIGIALVDNNGAQVIIPRTTNAGVNVFVEN